MKCKKCGHFGMVRRKNIYLCEWCGNEQNYEEEEIDGENFVEIKI